MSEEKKKKGRPFKETEISDKRLSECEDLTPDKVGIKRGRPVGSVAKTKKEKKQDKKVKFYAEKNHTETELNIKRRRRKKEGIYKYIELSADMIRDLDEVRLSTSDAFQTDGEPFISKAEIIAGSVFRCYVEQELLEDKHVVFLYFYKKCFGNYSRASDKMGISRRTVQYWEEQNSIFRGLMDDFREGFLDNTEEMLMSLINKENINAIMFYLKTKGKDRGYTEKNILQLEDRTEVVGFEFVDVNQEDCIEADVEENLLLENKK